MCGIAGIFLHRVAVPDRHALEKMAATMEYRGPDDLGFHLAESIGLVHRRLAIRDLSAAGHCPMASPDRRMHLVFNGEIYNWRELRQELESLGYVFASQSDSEVILHGYHAWSDALIPRLQGMFAIAIWDSEKRELFLARDRMGEKPIFFCATPEGLAFASTPAALKYFRGNLLVDSVGVACHLAHTFIPASHAGWKGIRVLSPGTWLRMRAGQVEQTSRYWDFPRIGPQRKGWSQSLLEVERVLDDSVRRCLDADVPVGVFLSGGVDSSLIAAMAARHQSDLKAFSLGFVESNFSELPFARQVAKHLRIEHHEVVLGVDDVVACLPHLVRQYGQPFGDASAIPSYLVSKLARAHVKVCLSGDGGDELFGGYWRLQAGVYAARYGKVVPLFLRQKVVPTLARVAGAAGRRLAAMNSLSLAPPGAGYTNSESWFNQLSAVAGPRLAGVLDKPLLAALRVGKAIDRPEASVVQRLLYDDIQIQFPDALLTKVDVASMAASLEVRAPFLDVRLMELAWSLPDRTKLRWGQRKPLLKKLAAEHVPSGVVYRPKMGFAMPLGEWFAGRLGEYVASVFADSHAVAEGYVRRGALEDALLRHRKVGGEATRLWLLLWLELWFRDQQRA
ncbi:asparagine synthase (glutamine-hydrolyzing) [Curvibacter delicatus]|uniref:asparagine synthase (glutamine-hydrolyzing) n=1 Tax=Curvibacter delicatus TaxID=80879 RepID=UPI0008301983|nr:asparagine synthase (glutamine-hydrolyzing) [Curvibacter delicatus]